MPKKEAPKPQKTLNDMNEQELKSLAYDLSVQINQARQNLNAVEEQIRKLRSDKQQG